MKSENMKNAQVVVPPSIADGDCTNNASVPQSLPQGRYTTSNHDFHSALVSASHSALVNAPQNALVSARDYTTDNAVFNSTSLLGKTASKTVQIGSLAQDRLPNSEAASIPSIHSSVNTDKRPMNSPATSTVTHTEPTTLLAASLYEPSKELFKPFNLDAYVLEHGITGEAAQFLREAARAPSRSPNGYLSNTVRYPCPINGHTITAESSGFEYPFILTITNRPDVLRVFEQGPKVVVHAKTAAGHPYTFNCTVDAVVCTTKGVEIYEVMAAAEVSTYCVEHRNRFQEIASHAYGSKAAAAFFNRWEFKHFIVTEHNLSPGFVKSADFLRPYRTGFSLFPITQKEANTVISCARDNPGCYVDQIQIEPAERRLEVVYHLIAKGDVFTHLSDGRLFTRTEVRLYPTAVHEQAFDLLHSTTRRAPADLSELNYLLKKGSTIEIKNIEYIVEKIGASELVLASSKTGNARTVSFAALLEMKPLIGRICGAEKTFEQRLSEAHPEDLLQMLRNNAILQKAAKGDCDGVSKRTLRRWRSEIKRQGPDGFSIEAFLPTRRGPEACKIDAKLAGLLARLIERDYLNPNGITARWVYLKLLNINNRFKLGRMPSSRTVARHCEKIDPYKKAIDTAGKRYATRFRPIHPKAVLLGNPNGVASWHRAHCDSTTIDLLTRKNGENERLYLIKMVDSFDGRVLCHCLTEEAPSEETAREILIKCVEQHRMLPAMITFDWGTEGKSTWLQMSLEQIGVTVFFRPKATPGSGANIETMFNKVNKQLFHNLCGSNKLMQKARMLTKKIDPRNRVVWTAAAIREILVEYFDLINDLPRRGRRAPNLVAMESVLRFGMPPTQVNEHEAFKQMLLPLVEGTTRVVSSRGTIRHREHSYFHEDLRAYAGKEVQVRYVKTDIQHVYVTLPDQGRRTLKCETSDLSIRYETPEDAMRIHNETRAAAGCSKSDNEARMGAFVTRVARLEKKLRAEKKRQARVTAAALTKVEPQTPRPPSKIDSNIVTMSMNLETIA